MNLLKWKIKIQTRFLPKFSTDEFKVAYPLTFHLTNGSNDNKNLLMSNFSIMIKAKTALRVITKNQRSV